MSTSPPHLDGWEIGPRQDEWLGFGLHPGQRRAADPAPWTFWLADTPATPERAAAWRDRMILTHVWRHPGVHTIAGGGIWQGRQWAVTTPVRHGARWSFRTQSPHHEVEVAVILRQALAGLLYAHGHSVFHGAIRPDALYLEGGTWRFAGLGLVDLSPQAAAPTAASAQSAAAPNALSTPVLNRSRTDAGADLAAVARLVPVLIGTNEEASAQLTGVVAALDAGDGALALDRLTAMAPAPAATPPRARPEGGEVTPVVRGATRAPAPAPLQIGRYTLLEKLAQGGQGVVWRAHDPELDRFVAVKVQHPVAMLPDHALARFRQEARAAARLDHRAIVRVLDFGSTAGGLFYAMELVEGVDLNRRIRELGRVEPLRAARWVAEVARGLAHAHREGIVHRDLKPSNIMLEGDDQPRLTDFGLALAVDVGDRLTRDGDVMGTPSYMAPEQAAGRLDLIGPRSDIYSLGAVLYELLSGQRPVRDGPLATVVFDIVYKSPVPLRSVAPATPPDLLHVCERAMALLPEDRYPTMNAFAEDLERFLVGEPVAARAPTWRARARSWVRRHRTASVATVSVLGAVVVLGGIGAGFVAHRVDAQAQREAEAARRVAAAQAAIEAELREGDATGAHRLFTELVAQPDIQGTAAWTDAWLAEADRRAAEDDNDGERDALGRVWLNAKAPDVRRIAMTRLAGSWRREQRYDRVAMVLDALTNERGGAPASAAEAALEAEAALYRWQTDGVAHPAAAIVAALATRTPIADVPEDVRLEPVVGGGHPAILRSPDARMAWRLLPDGATERLPAPPTGTSLQRFFRSSGALHAVATTDDAVLILRLDTGWVEEARLSLPGPHTLALVELDTAVPSLLVATEQKRQIVIVERDVDGRWAGSAPLWPSLALNSDFGGATAVDLDGDGSRELAVALGAWQSYDLRVLDRAGAGFRIRDRVRLGYLRAPHALTLAGSPGVVVGSTAAYRDPRIFRDRPPLQGMAVLQLRPQGLHVAQRIELAGGCDIIGAGDVDGDRRDDVVAACNGLAVFAQQAEPGLLAAAVSGLDLRGAADLDGDGDLEVVARETTAAGGRVVIAGAKGAVRPPDPRPTLDTRPVPSGLNARDAERWRREEVLVGLGLNQTALGWIGESEDATGASRVRRARLELGAGRYEEAVASAVAAIRAGAPEASVVASEAALLAGDPEAARAVLAADPSVDVSELRALARLPRETMDLAQELSSRWRIADPSVLRHRRDEGSLRVDMVGEPEVARLPLVTDGDGVRLEVALHTDVVEWDGGLEFSLETPRGDVAYVQLWLHGEGGGGAVATVGHVRFRGGQEGTVRLGPERRIAAFPAQLSLIAGMGGGGVRARMAVDGMVALSTRDRVDASNIPPAGRLDLVIRGWSDSSEAARLVGRVGRIVVDGARVAEGELPTDEDLAITELVNGRAERALELLAPFTSARAERGRMAALLDLGRAEEAAGLYRRWLAERPLAPAALAPLRTRPRWAVQAARAVLGAGWLGPTWESWAAPLNQHPDDPEVAQDFMSWAEDLGPLPAGVTDEHALNHAEATLQVAVVARADGRLTQAEGLANQAATDLAGRGTGETAVRRAVMEARAAVELASIAAVKGEEHEVRRHLEAALLAHPAPEALTERLVAAPAFQSYTAATWWAQLVEPYRRFGARARG